LKRGSRTLRHQTCLHESHLTVSLNFTDEGFHTFTPRRISQCFGSFSRQFCNTIPHVCRQRKYRERKTM